MKIKCYEGITKPINEGEYENNKDNYNFSFNCNTCVCSAAC
ncbi:hypothetical protein GMMP15_1990003 [Candidatus Magnetomoraceae bacterium gMMP-15]